MAKSKPLMVKLKTWEQLEKEGFKQDWDYCYVGDRRHPSARFKRSLIQTHLGREHQVLGIDIDDGKIEIQGGKRAIGLPFYLFEDDKILTRKIKDLPKFKFRGARQSAKFIESVGFTFPCEYQTLGIDDAKALASWILKVSK